MVHAARALGLGVMLGCMVESGLGIAPGAHIASLMDHVDLDGNLLLADDPWPGVEFVDGVQLPVRSGRGSVLRPRRLLILAEGRSGDPHFGKTARGVMRYRAEDVVARARLAERRERARGLPARRHGRRGAAATSRRPRSSASRRRAAGSRRRGASCSRTASAPGSTSRTACTSSSPTTPS